MIIEIKDIPNGLKIQEIKISFDNGGTPNIQTTAHSPQNVEAIQPVRQHVHQNVEAIQQNVPQAIQQHVHQPVEQPVVPVQQPVVPVPEERPHREPPAEMLDFTL